MALATSLLRAMVRRAQANMMTHILVRIDGKSNVIIDIGSEEQLQRYMDRLRKSWPQFEYAIEEVKAANTGE